MGWIRRALVAGMLVVVAAAGAGPAAADSPVGLCLPSAAGGAVTTPTSGTTCAGGGTYTQLARQSDLTAAESRVAALEVKLADVTKLTVNGQPTVRFSGVNVQVVNGAGTTNSTN